MNIEKTIWYHFNILKLLKGKILQKWQDQRTYKWATTEIWGDITDDENSEEEVDE
jgi:hypothetical protein